MSDFELGWVVGIIEGEGCLTTVTQWYRYKGTSKGPYCHPVIKVKMTDEDTIRQLHSIVGGVVNGPYQPSGNRKLVWVWSLNKAEDIVNLCDKITPFLSQRRKDQVKTMMSYSWGKQENFVKTVL